MTLSIRPAVANDAQVLYQMIRDLANFEDAAHFVKVTPDILRQQLSLAQPPFLCAIAENGATACGFALYYYAYSTWEGSATLYLEDLFVYPQFRGVGAGAALMTYLAHAAETNGCNRFEWSVLNWNDSAIGFYEKLGAKPLSDWTRYRLESDGIERLATKDLPAKNLPTSFHKSQESKAS